MENGWLGGKKGDYVGKETVVLGNGWLRCETGNCRWIVLEKG